MPVLSREQIDAFWRDGHLTVEDAVTPARLAALRAEIACWVEESRAHAEPFGPPTIDGRPRFDMGAEHTPDKPALRRVNNPSDISDAYRAVMLEARTVDMVADLIGPDVKFHHCKINLKLSGAKTDVAYHQDFAYTPHTNDDIVTALLFLDDIDESNGCLTVVPGSHKGPLLSLFDGERFTGAVAAELERQALAKSVPCLGKAGSVCLMHTKLLHGSAANASDQPRGVYICVYTAADGVPIACNPMPSLNEGRIVRGSEARFARLQAGLVELPRQPKSASFFTVLGQESKQASGAQVRPLPS
jgi:ectoine hydroxylase-related dioxygenase (phytanoyl-CoA dioxygenase family)